jgi:hypothetical protein
VYVGSRLKRAQHPGRRYLKCQPSSRIGENPPYGMIGGIEETSASCEARSAPRSYPTGGGRLPPVTRWEEPQGFPLSRLCSGRAGSEVCDTTAPRRLPSIAKPPAAYELKGRKIVSLLVRAQRNFSDPLARPGPRCFKVKSTSLAPSLRAKRSNPGPQERLDCFVAEPVIRRAFARPVGVAYPTSCCAILPPSFRGDA